MQIGVKLVAYGVNRPKAILGQKIAQLFPNHAHARKDGGIFPFIAGSGKPQLKIIDNRHEPLEQGTVRIFDGIIALTRGALFVILEICLGPQCQIAKTIQIGLQTNNWIIGSFSICRHASRFVLCRQRWRNLIFFPWFWAGFLHVLRMAITVMSSFCG